MTLLLLVIRSSGYGDELAWAAVWLYRATQNAAYLNDAKTFYQNYGLSGVSDFGWDNKGAGVQVLDILIFFSFLTHEQSVLIATEITFVC